MRYIHFNLSSTTQKHTILTQCNQTQSTKENTLQIQKYWKTYRSSLNMGYYMATLPLLRSFKMGIMQCLSTVVPLFNYVKHSVIIYLRGIFYFVLDWYFQFRIFKVIVIIMTL